MSKKPELIAYVATEGKDEKSFFTKIGAAWTNTKGGYNIRLDALPVGGEIVLLPPKEIDKE